MVVNLGMTQNNHENFDVFVPPKSPLSYVISITLPQPTIRIKIPGVLVNAMQSRRNRNLNENGTSTKRFKDKVGSMFSKVIGKKKFVAKTDYKVENVELHSNRDGDGDMNKLKNMVERVDNIDSNDSNVAFSAGRKGEFITTIGAKGVVCIKKVGNFSDSSASFRSETKRRGHGKLAANWLMKMGTKTEKQELCKKRILMGKKCMPLD